MMKNLGFITLPVLAIVVGTLVVGSAVGYGVSRFSQIVEENQRLTVELDRQTIDEGDISQIEEGDVDSEPEQIATSSNDIKEDDDVSDPVDIGEPQQHQESEVGSETSVQAHRASTIVSDSPVDSEDDLITNQEVTQAIQEDESVEEVFSDGLNNHDEELEYDAATSIEVTEAEDEEVDWSSWNFHIYIYRNSIDNLESDRSVVRKHIETTKDWQVIFHWYSSSDSQVIADVALRGYQESAQLLNILENIKSTIEDGIGINRRVQNAIRSENADELFPLIEDRDEFMQSYESKVDEYKAVYARNERIYDELANLTGL